MFNSWAHLELIEVYGMRYGSKVKSPYQYPNVTIQFSRYFLNSSYVLNIVVSNTGKFVILYVYVCVSLFFCLSFSEEGKSDSGSNKIDI